MQCAAERHGRVSHSRGGFTLVELLIFIAIFTTVMMAFIAIFVSTTRIHVRQLAAVEVDTQSQFLLQAIQYQVERSSLIDMAADTPGSSLTLRTSSSSTDPTYISLSDGKVYLTYTDGGTPEALTSDRVEVTNLSFAKRTNPPGHDSVAVSFTMQYVTNNLDQRFSNILQTAIARVSAATFDADVVPNSADNYSLGTGSSRWRSVNQTLYFSGSNVGIGETTPATKLEVGGGDIYVNTLNSGLILRDSGGGCWRVMATSTGALVTESLTCP